MNACPSRRSSPSSRAGVDVLDPARTFRVFHEAGVDFWTGVPDSLLKSLCAYVSDHAEPRRHVIAANEGGAVAIAGGHYLATGSPAVVYLQNSGIGNALNPLISLADSAVYGLPMLLLVGWRGEPGTVDEPQHLKQGAATIPLLEAAGVPFSILPDNESAAAATIVSAIESTVASSTPHALVIRKGTFAPYTPNAARENALPMTREEAIIAVTEAVEDTAVVIATTGKTSRELYEHRARTGSNADRDFLTVGSMGHASQIALGIDMSSDDRPVWVLDGDGALLMHLGAIGTIAEHASRHFKHVVLNNQVHDSVGGQPTATTRLELPDLARAAGYRHAASVSDPAALPPALALLRDAAGPALLEIRVRPGARADLGRPTSTPGENKIRLMKFLAQ